MATNPDIVSDIAPEVSKFFSDLNTAVERGNVAALHDIYEAQFEALTTKYYIVSKEIRSWPPLTLTDVSEAFTDPSAKIIYSFLFYKHLFTDRNVEQAEAKESWKTFKGLFAILNDGSCPLPSWMLWDIFDEFVYQMTVVYQKRFSTPTEWGVEETFRVLERVIAASNIASVMSHRRELEDLTQVRHNRALGGFFAVIAKAKVNVLLGDYYTALSELEVIDIHGAGRSVLMKVPPSQVSLLFNVGFSYLMLHRYEDASASFRRSLSIKSTGRRFSERLQLDAAYMYVCSRVLGGMAVINVSSLIDQRKVRTFEEEKELLRNGDEERFSDVFDRCCPKFLSVPTPSGTVKGTEGKEQQARMFRRAVQQQQEIIRLRDYFGVYQNTKVSLFQTLLETEDGLSPFFALKMRSRQLVHDGESADLMSGIYKVASQYDCVVDGDNVEVVPCTNFGGTENKLFSKIRTFQRLEYRQVYRKQLQAKQRSDNDGKRQQNGEKRRQNRGPNGQNRNRPNAGGDPQQRQQRRPNQGGAGGNRQQYNAAPAVSALADNLMNRNVS